MVQHEETEPFRFCIFEQKTFCGLAVKWQNPLGFSNLGQNLFGFVGFDR